MLKDDMFSLCVENTVCRGDCPVTKLEVELNRVRIGGSGGGGGVAVPLLRSVCLLSPIVSCLPSNVSVGRLPSVRFKLSVMLKGAAYMSPVVPAV